MRILLEAGAKTHQTNRIGRPSAQLAAFTGQKQCVDTINNYVTLDDLKYYTIPQGTDFHKIKKKYKRLSFCFRSRDRRQITGIMYERFSTSINHNEFQSNSCRQTMMRFISFRQKKIIFLI